MKKLLIVATAFFAVTGVARAAMSGSDVPAVDTAREGDLAKGVLAFFKANSKANETCSFTSYEVSKLETYSGHREKVPGTLTDYTGTYLAQRICNEGATFAGAGRYLEEALVIKADRTGLENSKQVIVPTQADIFTIVRAIDTKLLKIE
ncbi:MAG: hypothetical protein ABIR96_01405 [Bdellovibrionota bacterium]